MRHVIISQNGLPFPPTCQQGIQGIKITKNLGLWLFSVVRNWTNQSGCSPQRDWRGTGSWNDGLTKILKNIYIKQIKSKNQLNLPNKHQKTFFKFREFFISFTSICFNLFDLLIILGLSVPSFFRWKSWLHTSLSTKSKYLFNSQLFFSLSSVYFLIFAVPKLTEEIKVNTSQLVGLNN